jgi:hypothetical protein
MPDIPQIICDVMETRSGKIAVCSKLYLLSALYLTKQRTACANRFIRHSARNTVARNIHKDIRYLEFDYQPAESKPYAKRSESLQYQCRGMGEA